MRWCASDVAVTGMFGRDRVEVELSFRMRRIDTDPTGSLLFVGRLRRQIQRMGETS